jgi:hypothetical protein
MSSGISKLRGIGFLTSDGHHAYYSVLVAPHAPCCANLGQQRNSPALRNPHEPGLFFAKLHDSRISRSVTIAIIGVHDLRLVSAALFVFPFNRCTLLEIGVIRTMCESVLWYLSGFVLLI